MFNRIRSQLARIIDPSRTRVRMYAGARNSRLTSGWSSSNGSEDAELVASLTTLRTRSRSLVRDSAYAKRAKLIIVNNVVGAGVGLQAQITSTRDLPRENINDGIERAWDEWCRADNCHTGGALHFSDMERLLLGQVVEAGEIFIRKHYGAFGSSRIPLSLEIIEPERIAETYMVPGATDSGATVRMGVERDRFGRPLAYWIRDLHPSDVRAPVGPNEKVTRVPADQIIHLRLVDRWPQTRGVPWFHTAITRLNDMQEYTASELQAARLSAAYFGTIESADEGPLGPESVAADGTREYAIDAGMIQQLAPGEKFAFHSPNRPNSALDPFMRFMLREVASGVGVSYESISRDYSQSNYSSSRLALLEDRDLWQVLQQWWVRSFRAPLHREWLRQAVLSNSVKGLSIEQYTTDPQRFEAVTWKLRGWTWIDPTKEVEAYKEAVKAGFTTVTDVIAATAAGKDVEDVIAQRKRELAMFEEAGIDLDTTVPEEPPAQEEAPPDKKNDTQSTEQSPPLRVFSF